MIPFHPIGGMPPAPPCGALEASGQWRHMGDTPRFQETLRRLTLLDEGFVRDRARLCLDPPHTPALDARLAALLELAAGVAAGSPGTCLQWSTARALAAGATDDEIADVLMVIAPVAGLGRVLCAAPEVAAALGYDIEAALEDPGEHRDFHGR
jgi:4-carboxymuconolactone decarboxylase